MNQRKHLQMQTLHDSHRNDLFTTHHAGDRCSPNLQQLITGVRSSGTRTNAANHVNIIETNSDGPATIDFEPTPIRPGAKIHVIAPSQNWQTQQDHHDLLFREFQDKLDPCTRRQLVALMTGLLMEQHAEHTFYRHERSRHQSHGASCLPRCQVPSMPQHQSAQTSRWDFCGDDKPNGVNHPTCFHLSKNPTTSKSKTPSSKSLMLQLSQTELSYLARPFQEQEKPQCPAQQSEHGQYSPTVSTILPPRPRGFGNASLQSSRKLHSSRRIFLDASTDGPGEADIVCARGRRFFYLPGCVRYREILHACIPEYMAANTREGRSAVITKVIKTVQVTEKARFLKYHKKRKAFSMMTLTEVRDKVGHALRTGVNEIEGRHEPSFSEPHSSDESSSN